MFRTMWMFVGIFCLLILIILISLGESGPQKKLTRMRWAKTWADAREEAWMRGCALSVHFHDDADDRSQSMYPFFQDSSFVKAASRMVHLIIVNPARDHPTVSVKNDEAEAVEVSRIFFDLTMEELNTLRGKPDESFKLKPPYKSPAFIAYTHGGEERVKVVGEMKMTTFKKEIEDVVSKVGGKNVVPAEEFMYFYEERQVFRKFLQEEKWKKASAILTYFYKGFKKYDRFISKTEDMQEEMNILGLALIDKAMDESDPKAKAAAVKFVMNSFVNLDAGERAREIYTRIK